MIWLLIIFLIIFFIIFVWIIKKIFKKEENYINLEPKLESIKSNFNKCCQKINKFFGG